ncbi:hypothetical protein HPL003_20410 [Paenibacillus terrae HPL-003]|uniref:Uncharacterized protein n=1 Tax=Paenibacillus terrae (strain HPL-003) TaxID=985665 RepID=G7VS11_PAETH|nr:hypothetical protein [Paenibacillus terrae]AET60818.1 hypothetical protein HPL003_20410 [Paenibacillus terrae HPL-003]
MDHMSSFWAWFIVVDIVIFWFLFRALYRKNRGSRRTRRRNAFFLHSPSPSSLAQGRHKEIIELMQLLEQSIPASYAHSVRRRVMEAHPHLTEQEYDWRWNELKRYFMLCAIMNRVPMFSPDGKRLPKVNYLQIDYLLLAVVWYSWYHPLQFALHMHPDATGSAALASSSGCSSASGCSNWDTHHSHHHSSHDSSHDGGSTHHDSGDSGGSHSSCSSSSSCGSSCGGGGD